MNIIYRITNVITNNQYIGVFSGTVENFDNCTQSIEILHSEFQEFGIENFEKDILEYSIQGYDLYDLRRSWVIKLKTLSPYGYNTYSEMNIDLPRKHKSRKYVAIKIWNARRKNGNDRHTPETIEKLKEINKQNAKNPITRERIRQAQILRSSALKRYFIQNNITSEILEIVGRKAVVQMLNNHNKEMCYTGSSKSQTNELLGNTMKTKDFILIKKIREYVGNN